MAKLKKRVKITVSVAFIVAIILATVSGIFLFVRGGDLLDTALRWTFGLSIGIIIVTIFGGIVWISGGRTSKFVRRK